MLRRMGRLDAAVASYQRALTLAPDNPNMLSSLGNALRALGRLGEAEKVQARSVKMAPADRSLRYNYALTLRDMRKINEALRFSPHCMTNIRTMLKSPGIWRSRNCNWAITARASKATRRAGGCRATRPSCAMARNGTASTSPASASCCKASRVSAMPCNLPVISRWSRRAARASWLNACPSSSTLFATIPGVEEVITKGEPARRGRFVDPAPEPAARVRHLAREPFRRRFPTCARRKR